jgi:hypothetical protein
MRTDRDTTRIVRSWLEYGRTALPDHVLDAVLDQLPATRQRRSPWPARRFAEMNNFAKLASAIAAVVVVAVVGYNLLPGGGPGVGGPQVTSSLSAPPAPTATPAPSPTLAAAFPPGGPLAVGRHIFTEDDLEFSLAISSSGWVSEGYRVDEQGGTIRKGSFEIPDAAWVLIWSVDGVYTDPCAHVAGPVLNGSPAELAAAVAGLPGAAVSGPTDTTIGGYPAKHVTLVYGTDAGCAPNAYYLWYNDLACGLDDPCQRWLSASNSTLRVWIVDVDGTHFWIEAETYDGASPELDQEIRDMVASIQFE